MSAHSENGSDKNVIIYLDLPGVESSIVFIFSHMTVDTPGILILLCLMDKIIALCQKELYGRAHVHLSCA